MLSTLEPKKLPPYFAEFVGAAICNELEAIASRWNVKLFLPRILAAANDLTARHDHAPTREALERIGPTTATYAEKSEASSRARSTADVMKRAAQMNRVTKRRSPRARQSSKSSMLDTTPSWQSTWNLLNHTPGRGQ